eukprot:CAMPEP_0206518856 /NCGR_PEP_ID=MMETSP0324_2-20121206/64819_1 /ASSEMBLY_ACC=CAM_ASM_000836 /TAXON_ID=2866 /ORGANISM="Crypthecodinium cohnii, Strain Seligo" /LENGTH=479 /DNA_ID=CAMNT_0054012275 /DNA_START=52 /DNA_END=1491 /DNA_ORIENTATION=-
MATIPGSDYDYVIVGAGPAGLASAGHLAKGGAKVAIFDFRPRPQDVFGSYPVVINPRGMKSLEKLDPEIAKKAREVGMEVKELHIVPDNRTVAKVKTYGTGIMRDQIAYILLEHCEQSGKIDIFWEHKLEELDVAKRSLRFSTKTGLVLVEDIKRLVAADGNRSRVRRACVAQVDGFTAEELPWGFQLRFMNSKQNVEQTEINKDFHYVLGDKGYVCQQPNGVWSVSLRVLPGVDEDFLTANEATEERMQKLKAYTEEHAGWVAKNLLDEDAYRGFYDCRSFDGVVIKCSCLNPAGWIVIVGDGAHAVQPATGEGINSGLEDASILGECCANETADEDRFAAYNRVHLADAHALQQLALQAKDKVVSSPRDRATNIMVTIGLGIAKKTRIIEGTMQDFMLGELAQIVGVKPYSELMAMEARQTRGLRAVAGAITSMLRLSTEKPEVKETEEEESAATTTPPEKAATAAPADQKLVTMGA